MSGWCRKNHGLFEHFFTPPIPDPVPVILPCLYIQFGIQIFFVDSVHAVIDLMPSFVDQDLNPPFINSASVNNLQIVQHHILDTDSQEYMELANRLQPKTFVSHRLPTNPRTAELSG
jgi:hypothetical protein